MDALTPPPSFRALRVRARPRTNSHALVAPDENKCPKCDSHASTKSLEEPSLSLRSHPSLLEKRFIDSQSRGRSRQRQPRLGLKVDVPSRPRQLSLVIPQSECCSPLPSQNKPQTPSREEELMFHMSPVQAQSPSSLFLNDNSVPSFQSLVATKATAEQTSAKVLSLLWTSTHGPDRRIVREGSRKRVRPKGCTRTVKPRRSQLYITDAWRQSEPTYTEISDDTNAQSLPSPRSPRSPEEPFMYSFPIFNSSPLVQARLHRARRAAAGTICGDGTQAPMLDPAADTPAKTPSLGPIRARNLRIQSGASLFSDDDEGQGREECITLSTAFGSASLEGSEKGDGVCYDDEDFVSSTAESTSTSSVSWSSSSPSAEKMDSLQASYRSRVSDALMARPSAQLPVSEDARSRRPPRRSCPPVLSHPAHARGAATEDEINSAMLSRGRARHPAQAFTRFASQETGRAWRGRS